MPRITEQSETKGAAREWQPISTAPKDGTLVDLWLISTEHGTGRREADAFWNKEAGEWQFGHFHAGQFVHRPKITHWRSIPDGPTASVSLSVPNGWRDIASAPKDRNIIGWGARVGRHMCRWSDILQQWSKVEASAQFQLGAAAITHWQPLPEPPAATLSKAES